MDACAADSSTSRQLPVGTSDDVIDVLSAKKYITNASADRYYLTPVARRLIQVQIGVHHGFPLYNMRRNLPLQQCTTWDMIQRLEDEGHDVTLGEQGYTGSVQWEATGHTIVLSNHVLQVCVCVCIAVWAA